MPSRTHILDLLILAVTFLCVIHSHSSASERHRPIRTTLTLGISHLVSTRKPSHLSTQNPSKIHNKLYISLILSMHDIKINPGPRSPKFPCDICHKAVTSSQRGVACDTCDTWHHTTCMHMSSTVYDSLHNISWHCISCSISQPTSSLPSSPITGTSLSNNNSFSSLNISTSPSTSPSNNRLASPPTTTTQRHAHKPLKIININFQSIKNKTAELGNVISTHDPDILIGTETWLNHTTTDNEIFPPGYSLLRKGRNDGYGGGGTTSH